MRTMTMAVLAFVVAITTVWAEVAITAHFHNGGDAGSDGLFSPATNAKLAQQAGGQVIIFSDHAEMVNERYKYYDAYPLWPLDHAYPETPGSKARILMSSDGMLEGWIAAMNGRFVIPHIPGMECGLGPGHKSHLLFWGGQPEDYRAVVYLEGHAQDDPERTLRQLIILAAQKGAVLVQAHPCSRFYPFLYGMDQVEGSVFGVEFFNCMGLSEQVGAFDRMLELQSHCAFPVIATGGTDWHGNADAIADVLERLGTVASTLNPGTAIGRQIADVVFPSREDNAFYKPSLARRTIALTDDCSAAGVMAALRSHRCYACFEPGGQLNRILGASAMPGEQFQPTEENKGDFRIRITNLGRRDEVTIGIVGRNGRIQKVTYTGDRFEIGGGTTLVVHLREFCSREDNCGWWLFVMTPRVVTSAIEILPWPAEQIAQTPPRSPAPGERVLIGGEWATVPPLDDEPIAPPPTTTTPPPAQTSQDPMALISGYPYRYCRKHRETYWNSQVYLSAWVGLELGSGGHGVIVVEAEGGGRKYRRVARVASDDINWGSPKVAIEPFTIGGKTYRWVHISPSLTNISIDERLCVVVWYPWDFAPGEPGGCDNVCVSRIR